MVFIGGKISARRCPHTPREASAAPLAASHSRVVLSEERVTKAAF